MTERFFWALWKQWTHLATFWSRDFKLELFYEYSRSCPVPVLSTLAKSTQLTADVKGRYIKHWSGMFWTLIEKRNPVETLDQSKKIGVVGIRAVQNRQCNIATEQERECLGNWGTSESPRSKNISTFTYKTQLRLKLLKFVNLNLTLCCLSIHIAIDFPTWHRSYEVKTPSRFQPVKHSVVTQ